MQSDSEETPATPADTPGQRAARAEAILMTRIVGVGALLIGCAGIPFSLSIHAGLALVMSAVAIGAGGYNLAFQGKVAERHVRRRRDRENDAR